MEKNNSHLYLGLGSFVILSLRAFIVYHITKPKKRNKWIAPLKTEVDLSVFDSPDVPGSGRCIDRGLLSMLKALEKKTGYPVFSFINSGVRSDSHNKMVGGVINSSHKIPFCKAVDIGVPNTFIRNLLVYAAKEVGFKRIGVGKTFVHLDVDSFKAQYVAWGYPKGKAPAVNPFT